MREMIEMIKKEVEHLNEFREEYEGLTLAGSSINGRSKITFTEEDCSFVSAMPRLNNSFN